MHRLFKFADSIFLKRLHMGEKQSKCYWIWIYGIGLCTQFDLYMAVDKFAEFP